MGTVICELLLQELSFKWGKIAIVKLPWEVDVRAVELSNWKGEHDILVVEGKTLSENRNR
jgi:hypothetical protein